MTYPHDTDLAAYLARTAPHAHPDIIKLYAELKSPDCPSAFSRKACQAKGGWGQTTQVLREQSGVFRTVHDGKTVLTTATSLYEYLIERVIAAHPAVPMTRRQPTQNELEGLRRANEQRRLEGEARRAARKAQETATGAP
jgi:hypothetical protein